MSVQNNEPRQDSIQHLSSLKERLEKYKQKNQVIVRLLHKRKMSILIFFLKKKTQKEIELEAMRIEKEKLDKEREAIRLETEKQALILELQRVSMVKAGKLFFFFA